MHFLTRLFLICSVTQLTLAVSPVQAGPALQNTARQAIADRATPADQATLLRLESKALGQSRILYNKVGMRLEFDRGHTIVSMKAPNWKVQFWSHRSKVYYECEPNDWKPRIGIATALFRPSASAHLRTVSSAPDTFAGIKARKYALTSSDSQLPASRGWRGLLVRGASYWVLDDTSVPESVSRVIQRTYGIPTVAGIPLELQTTNLKGNTQSELRFISKSAKAFFPADFEVPAGFERVKEAEQVTNNADFNGGFADFIR